MGYIDRQIADSEVIVHRGGYHWFHHAQAWAALILLGVFIIGIVIFAVIMIRIATTDFVVTDRRLILKRGFLAIEVESLALEAVETVRLHESVLGRLLAFGQLTVHGQGDEEIVLPVMARPSAFSAALEEARIKLDDRAA
ncbi:MAG: PH domain-containing protein [Pseudomonadota bacterium]